MLGSWLPEVIYGIYLQNRQVAHVRKPKPKPEDGYLPPARVSVQKQQSADGDYLAASPKVIFIFSAKETERSSDMIRSGQNVVIQVPGTMFAC